MRLDFGRRQTFVAVDRSNPKQAAGRFLPISGAARASISACSTTETDMKTIFSAIALMAVMASPAFAQLSVSYYNVIPSSRSPAITSDPSPRGLVDGDYVARDPDPAIQWELTSEPSDDRLDASRVTERPR